MARSGPGPGRCFPVFPKVDAASPRGLMAPPGLSALGAKGSACDRLRLTGGLRALALGRYIVSLRWRGGRPFGRHFLCRLWRLKPYNRPDGRGNAIPLWWLAPPPFLRSSVGRQKESALMGRLGALLRPTWRSYAGPPQGHYKAPLCCELLMKGLLFKALLSHRSAGGRWCRKAPKGGKPPEMADYRSAYHNV